ncbi:MAG: DUF4411 family protein [Epsilonproteobacteria bacterium]|nr:DUF4411 family protein [Campylobacterota bacterium]
MTYLLDANILIQAKNLHYGMDFCPAFWDFIEENSTNSIIASVDMIYTELTNGNDELADWVKDKKDDITFFSSADENTQNQFGEIANFVNNNGFSENEITRFLGGADPWLIAKAAVLEEATIVTHETLIVSATIRKVKIPNICEQFGVSYMDPFDMIRELNGKFELAL